MAPIDFKQLECLHKKYLATLSEGEANTEPGAVATG
jgi:hypothetical protein